MRRRGLPARLLLWAGLLLCAVYQPAAADPGTADIPPADQLLTASPDRIRAAIQQLPPEIQDQIRQQLRSKSLDDLMATSPDQLRAAVGALSPDAKAALKARWQALPEDRKATLKSLDLKALWRQAVARFQAMGPGERALVKKLLGEATGEPVR